MTTFREQLIISIASGVASNPSIGHQHAAERILLITDAIINQLEGSSRIQLNESLTKNSAKTVSLKEINVSKKETM